MKSSFSGEPASSGSCKTSVARAYYEMLDSGASRFGALDAAAHVYRYHNPMESMRDARQRVETWLNLRIVQ